MEAEKKKKNARPRLGTLPFTGLWAGAYALGWGLPIAAVILIISVFPGFIQLFPEAMVIIGFIAIPGFIISLAQHFLIQARTGRAIRRWWLWSSLGWLIGGLVFYLFTLYPFNAWISAIESFILNSTLGFGFVFLPHILVQMWMLRRRVRRAWMWPVAALASAALFIMPIIGSSAFLGQFTAAVIIGAGGLLQGWVMGMALLWLLNMGVAFPAEEATGRSTDNTDKQYNRLMLPAEEAEEDIFQASRAGNLLQRR